MTLPRHPTAVDLPERTYTKTGIARVMGIQAVANGAASLLVYSVVWLADFHPEGTEEHPTSYLSTLHVVRPIAAIWMVTAIGVMAWAARRKWRGLARLEAALFAVAGLLGAVVPDPHLLS